MDQIIRDIPMLLTLEEFWRVFPIDQLITRVQATNTILGTLFLNKTNSTNHNSASAAAATLVQNNFVEEDFRRYSRGSGGSGSTGEEFTADIIESVEVLRRACQVLSNQRMFFVLYLLTIAHSFNCQTMISRIEAIIESWKEKSLLPHDITVGLVTISQSSSIISTCAMEKFANISIQRNIEINLEGGEENIQVVSSQSLQALRTQIRNIQSIAAINRSDLMSWMLQGTGFKSESSRIRKVFFAVFP